MAATVDQYEGKVVTDATDGKSYFVYGGKIWYIESWSDFGATHPDTALASVDVATWPKGTTYKDIPKDATTGNPVPAPAPTPDQPAVDDAAGTTAGWVKPVMIAVGVIGVAGIIYYLYKKYKK